MPLSADCRQLRFIRLRGREQHHRVRAAVHGVLLPAAQANRQPVDIRDACAVRIIADDDVVLRPAPGREGDVRVQERIRILKLPQKWYHIAAARTHGGVPVFEALRVFVGERDEQRSPRGRGVKAIRLTMQIPLGSPSEEHAGLLTVFSPTGWRGPGAHQTQRAVLCPQGMSFSVEDPTADYARTVVARQKQTCGSDRNDNRAEQAETKEGGATSRAKRQDQPDLPQEVDHRHRCDERPGVSRDGISPAYFTTAATAASWNALRTSELSEFGKLERWTIRTKPRRRCGSIQAWVP